MIKLKMLDNNQINTTVRGGASPGFRGRGRPYGTGQRGGAGMPNGYQHSGKAKMYDAAEIQRLIQAAMQGVVQQLGLQLGSSTDFSRNNSAQRKPQVPQTKTYQRDATGGKGVNPSGQPSPNGSARGKSRNPPQNRQRRNKGGTEIPPTADFPNSAPPGGTKQTNSAPNSPQGQKIQGAAQQLQNQDPPKGVNWGHFQGVGSQSLANDTSSVMKGTAASTGARTHSTAPPSVKNKKSKNPKPKPGASKDSFWDDLKELQNFSRQQQEEIEKAPPIKEEEIDRFFCNVEYAERAIDEFTEFNHQSRDTDLSDQDHLIEFKTTLGNIYVRKDIDPINLAPEVWAATAKRWGNYGKGLVDHQGIHINIDPKHRGVLMNGREQKFAPDVKAAVQAQIDEYVKAGFIREKGPKDKSWARVPLKAIARKDGKIRLIQDARELNTVCFPPPVDLPHILRPFQLTDPTKPIYYCKIDLSDAFLHLPLSQETQNWFTFKFENKEYRWTRLGFGWNMAPFHFQQVMRAVCDHISSDLVQLSLDNYQDDLTAVSQDLDKLKEQIIIIVGQLESLGFKINKAKSQLEPKRVMDWLGFHYSPEGISLSDDARAELKARIQKFESQPTVRNQLSLLGFLQWACAIFRHGLPDLAVVQKSIPGEDRCIRANHNKTLTESQKASFLSDLAPIVRMALDTTYFWYPRVWPRTYQVFTDASKEFLGFVCRTDPIQEKLTEAQKTSTIGHLETLAILRVIEEAPKRCNLIVHTDSENALYSIQKCATASTCNVELIMNIQKLLREKEIALVCRRVDTKDNPADQPSRVPLTKLTTWKNFFIAEDSKNKQLSPKEYFNWLTNNTERKPSTQARRFVSWLMSPKAAQHIFGHFMNQIANGRGFLYKGYNSKLLARAYLVYRVNNPWNKIPKEQQDVLKKIERRLLDAQAMDEQLVKEALTMKPIQIQKLVDDFSPSQNFDYLGYTIGETKLLLFDQAQLPKKKKKGPANENDDIIMEEEKKDPDNDDQDPDYDDPKGYGKNPTRGLSKNQTQSNMSGLFATILNAGPRPAGAMNEAEAAENSFNNYSINTSQIVATSLIPYSGSLPPSSHASKAKHEDWPEHQAMKNAGFPELAHSFTRLWNEKYPNGRPEVFEDDLIETKLENCLAVADILGQAYERHVGEIKSLKIEVASLKSLVDGQAEDFDKELARQQLDTKKFSDRVDQLEKAARSALADFDKAEDQVKTLEDRMAEMAKDHQLALDVKIAELNKAASEEEKLRGLLKKAEAQVTDLNSDLDKLRAQLDAKSQKEKEEEGKANPLQAELDTAKASVTSLEKELADTKAKLSTVEEKKAAFNNNYLKLLELFPAGSIPDRTAISVNNAVADLIKNEKSLKDDLESTNAALETAKGKLDTATTDLSRLTAQLQDADASLKLTVDKQARLIDAQIQKIKELNGQISDLKIKEADLSTEQQEIVKGLQSKLEEVVKEKTKVQEELISLQTQLTQERGNVNASKAKASQSDLNADTARTELARVRDDMAKQHETELKARSDLQRKLDQQSQQLAKLQSEHSNCPSQQKSLQDTVTSLRSEVSSISSKLTSSQMETEAAKVTVKDLQAEVDQFRQAWRDIDALYDQLRLKRHQGLQQAHSQYLALKGQVDEGQMQMMMAQNQISSSQRAIQNGAQLFKAALEEQSMAARQAEYFMALANHLYVQLHKIGRERVLAITQCERLQQRIQADQQMLQLVSSETEVTVPFATMENPNPRHFILFVQKLWQSLVNYGQTRIDTGLTAYDHRPRSLLELGYQPLMIENEPLDPPELLQQPDVPGSSNGATLLKNRSLAIPAVIALPSGIPSAIVLPSASTSEASSPKHSNIRMQEGDDEEKSQFE